MHVSHVYEQLGAASVPDTMGCDKLGRTTRDEGIVAIKLFKVDVHILLDKDALS